VEYICDLNYTFLYTTFRVQLGPQTQLRLYPLLGEIGTLIQSVVGWEGHVIATQPLPSNGRYLQSHYLGVDVV
jgi:hypothetical protein